MATCLGLYIENHIIKYAKVTKDNDNIKIDSFGMKFYDKLSDSIKQIIEETYSYKTPISINLSNEEYNYFYLFSLLSKKDMENVINTEFESICYDNGVNKDAFETRYVLVNDLQDKEKVKAIHVSANKVDIAKKEQQLEKYRVVGEVPIGTSIGNLIDDKETENVIIINIEEKTTVTTIVDKKIINVQTIADGATQILDNINIKENSYLKSYNVCKDSTIYTPKGKDLQYEENEYLDYIMPTLYNIVTEVRKIVDQSLNRIDKIYITGTGCVINNIDIYFQEYLKDIKCEILKPYFLNNIPMTKINIKDYIEVNSAIAIALDGVGQGIKGLNFKKEGLKDWLTVDIGSKTGKSRKSRKGLQLDFGEKLTRAEKGLTRVAIGLLILILMYSGVSLFLNKAIKDKSTEVKTATEEVNIQIGKINSDITKLRNNTNKYNSMKERLESLTSETQDRNKRKNSIPTLLNQIMYIIPQGVQITSIENTTDSNIVINAQSATYEQLGYLKSKIKEDGILLDVQSDSGQKEGQTGVVKAVIEGRLPIE